MPRVTVLHRTLVTVWLLGLLGLACRDEQPDENYDTSNTTESFPASEAEKASRTLIECVDRPVRMAVASSLRELSIFLDETLRADDPPLAIELIFGASSAHARQLALGAPMDVLVTADAEIVDDLVQRGFLSDDSKSEFAYGQLSFVARRGWPHQGSIASALTSESFKRLALPSAAVPLGRYARAWLDSQGLLDRLKGKIVVTEHARATLAAVDAGLVDLAIVYRSELRLAKHAVEVEPIDPSEYPPIRYVAARLTAAPNCSSIDRAIAAWTHPIVQDELVRAGFLLAKRRGAL